MFITGADHVPPRGFPEKLKINFFSLEEGIQRLPFVSTCALELHLPRGYSDPERFRDLMIRSIKESFGFEKL